MRVAAAFVALALLAACSKAPTVIDGTSPAAFEKTTEKARRDLSIKDRLAYDAALRNPTRRLLVGEAAGAAVGVLRFDFGGDQATVSIYLTPQGHGRGVGPELLTQGQAWLQRNRPGTKRITAQIRPGNQASIAAFTAARYRRENEHYVRDLLHDVAKTH